MARTTLSLSLSLVALFLPGISLAQFNLRPEPPDPPDTPAAPAPPAQSTATAIEVHVGESTLFQLPRPPMIIGTEDPSIARVTVRPNGQVVVYGLTVGRTRIIGRDFAQRPLIFPVVVLEASAR